MNDNSVIKQLQLIRKSERRFYLETYVRRLFCSALHIENPDEIASSVSFFEQGLTSLRATELQYTLEKTLEIHLNSSILFNFSTIDSLIEFLLQQKLNHLFAEEPNKDFPIEGQQELEPLSSLSENDYIKRVLKKQFNI